MGKAENQNDKQETAEMNETEEIREAAAIQEAEIRSPYQAPANVTGDEVLSEIRQLYGFEELISLCEDIHAMAPLIRERGLDRVVSQRGYLFSIEPGGGCTKAAWSLANLLNADGLVPERLHVIEVGDISDSQTESLINTGIITLLAQIHDMIVVMDIGEIAEETGSGEFLDFIIQIQHMMEVNRLIPIFLVPFLENDALLRIQNDIADIINLDTLVFVPLSFEEYTIAAANQLKGYGYQADVNCLRYIHTRLLEEIADGRYYGFKTVRKVVDEIIYGKIRSVSVGTDQDIPVITDDYLPVALQTYPKGDPKTALAEMPGLTSVSDQLLSAFEDIQKNLKKKNRKPLRFCFAGNPGTGKSTAASLFGRMLYQEGILKTDRFLEYQAEDLIGWISGQTGPLVARICRDALEGVLFIDNAGSFCGDSRETEGYADEAVKALICQMERRESNMCIILSDTKERMEKLLASCPELAAMIPQCIEFPDHSTSQLADIFLSMAEERGLELEEGLESAIKDYFNGLKEDALKNGEFTNGRYVRNLFDRTCSKYITRTQLEGTEDTILILQDFREAAANITNMNEKSKRRTTIGFGI